MARQPEERCRLLELPRELRDHIYRFAVVDNGSVHVAANGYDRPHLMVVCRQIREEVSSIFYSDNHFAIDFVNYDFKPYYHLLQQFRAYGSKDRGVKVTLNASLHTSSSAPSCWANLLFWLQVVHEGRGTRCPPSPSMIKDRANCMEGALNMAFTIASSLQGVPWERVRGLLEEQRWVLAGFDENWAR